MPAGISLFRMQRKRGNDIRHDAPEYVCPTENKSESPMARNRPRRVASRRDTTSAHGGSPGERKVYITEEFDSTSGTWPRPLSYLGKYACPTGRHAAACARRSYYSLLRNRRSRVSTDHPKLWGVSRQLGPRGFRLELISSSFRHPGEIK